jgi:formamidase
VRWVIADGVARSPDLPGVAIPGEPFVGVVGVAPSAARMQAFTDRERALGNRGAGVRLPDSTAAVPTTDPVAGDGLRTVPPRETGGNIDVKQAGVGSRVLLPVDVPCALLSVGDAHFAQGDGEVCSQAIEMHARAQLRIDLVKASERSFRATQPTIEFTEPARGRRSWFATTGIPVDGSGVNHHFDLYVAAQAAVREMIGYLVATRGFTREQAYALCSVAVDLRVSEVVNTPNGVVAALLPLDVFAEDAPDQ